MGNFWPHLPPSPYWDDIVYGRPHTYLKLIEYFAFYLTFCLLSNSFVDFKDKSISTYCLMLKSPTSKYVCTYSYFISHSCPEIFTLKIISRLFLEIIGKPLSYLNSVDKINFANQQDTKLKVTKIHIFIFVLQAKRELKKKSGQRDHHYIT